MTLRRHRRHEAQGHAQAIIANVSRMPRRRAIASCARRFCRQARAQQRRQPKADRQYHGGWHRAAATTAVAIYCQHRCDGYRHQSTRTSMLASSSTSAPTRARVPAVRARRRRRRSVGQPVIDKVRGRPAARSGVVGGQSLAVVQHAARNRERPHRHRPPPTGPGRGGICRSPVISQADTPARAQRAASDSTPSATAAKIQGSRGPNSPDAASRSRWRRLTTSVGSSSKPSELPLRRPGLPARRPAGDGRRPAPSHPRGARSTMAPNTCCSVRSVRCADGLVEQQHRSR